MYREYVNVERDYSIRDLDELSRLVRQRRQALGLAQVQLADRLQWTQERISGLEDGAYSLPSLPERLLRFSLAGVLLVSSVKLL